MQHKCQCNKILELSPWGSNWLADCPKCGQYVISAVDAAIENSKVVVGDLTETAKMAEAYVDEKKRGRPAKRS